MNSLQDTLVRELYKVRKSGIKLDYPVSDKRLEIILSELLENYNLKCKTTPRVKCKQKETGGRLEYTTAIIEMALIYVDDENGIESSTIKITLYFDSYINKNDEPEFGIAGDYKNKYKEAIYRPYTIQDENDIKGYIANILNDISHTYNI